MTCDDCHDIGDLAHASKRYRRALALVVILNLGMGVVEMAGGLLGLSQALKADALDFLGDGFVTLLGLLAISRGPKWRARAALLQGVFLALLALGVLGAAAHRAVEQKVPEAAMMGGLGILALVTNVVAALILVPLWVPRTHDRLWLPKTCNQVPIGVPAAGLATYQSHSATSRTKSRRRERQATVSARDAAFVGNC